MKCARCNLPAETVCDGSGLIMVEEGTTRRCRNMLALILRSQLGTEFEGVQHVRNSPLYTTSDSGGDPVADLTGENLYITGSRTTVLAHLKWALGMKTLEGMNFLFRIFTDERIKNVFVGSEAYKSRPRDAREDEPIFNSLTDLVGEPKLVIIKLGYLGYKNIAAAGALKEALLIRAGKSSKASPKATWLVEDDDYPWTFSKDPDVETYVQSRFAPIHLSGAVTVKKAPPIVQAMSFDDEEEGIGASTTSLYEIAQAHVAAAASKPLPSKRKPAPKPVEVESTPMPTSFDFGFPGANDKKKKWR